MSLSRTREQQAINNIARPINGDLIEKVILQNDLSGLSPVEKVQHIKNICDSLGLNPTTHPIALMKFQGKEIPYVKKDGTEQLRKINRVSITGIESKMLTDGVYVVIANACTPDGRQDSSTGVISLAGLKGEGLANAMMKAETKAKRRVTLSICGLGFLDESELESMPGHQRLDAPENNVKVMQYSPSESLKIAFDGFMSEMQESQNEKSLKNIFEKIKMINWMGSDYLNKLVAAKDVRKNALSTEKFIEELGSIDEETGEIEEAEEVQNVTV